jgi:hypothetical protein
MAKVLKKVKDQVTLGRIQLAFSIFIRITLILAVISDIFRPIGPGNRNPARTFVLVGSPGSSRGRGAISWQFRQFSLGLVQHESRLAAVLDALGIEGFRT